MFHISSSKITVPSPKAPLVEFAIDRRTEPYLSEHGFKLDALLAKTCQADAAIRINAWISSPGLRKPT